MTMLVAGTLWWREIVRFYRQPNRVIGALGTPVVFWLLIGTGLGDLAGFFPGIVVLILLFTSIFSSFSIIEDRNEGFLQSVLVAPVGRGSVVMGKVLGGATLAAMQAGIFLALGPAVGIAPRLASIPMIVGLLMLISFGLTALGFMIAWRMDSTQGFHAIMNLVLVPMWLLSGAFFPMDCRPAWLQWVMACNPLTYGVRALRDALANESPGALSLAVTAGFGMIMFGGACLAARRSISADLR